MDNNLVGSEGKKAGTFVHWTNSENMRLFTRCIDDLCPGGRTSGAAEMGRYRAVPDPGAWKWDGLTVSV